MSTVQRAWQKLVLWGFDLLYHDLSWTYDAVSHGVSLGHWRAWRQAALPFLSGPCVLELGFGPGHLQVELAGQGFDAAGLDASPQMARQARRRLTRAGLPAALVNGRAQHLPFPDGSFTSVVATFPTPYIADPATLAEVRRVLTPGGRLVIVPEAQLSGGGPLRRAIDAAYRLTGQRTTTAAPQQRWSGLLCARITAAGLDCTVREVDLGDSRVTVLVAVRVGDS